MNGINLDTFSVASTLYLNAMDKTMKHEGKAKAIELFKAYLLIAKQIATKQSITPVPFRKSDKEGVPQVLKPLLPFLRGSPNEIRLALTVCRVVEALHLPPSFDTSILTNAGPELPQSFSNHFQQWLPGWLRKTFGVIRITAKEPRGSRLVRGPNGPGIATAHYDAFAVMQDKQLSSALKTIGTLTAPHVFPWMEKVASLTQPGDYLHSRIALLSEGAGKTRLVAIGDYWSQLTLEPIHDIIMSKLRKMETDGTYDQDNQAMRVARMTNHESHSFDLSNATDRFPVEIQRWLISCIMGEPLSFAWKEVMTNRTFKMGNQLIKWGRGQPLGLYSSWAVFALTHHAIVEYAAHLEGFNSFRDYSVLGDDLVIHNKRVASKYQQIMEQIDVKINMSKSVVSDGVTRRSEFAKRTFRDGTELSGLRFDIVQAAGSSLLMIPDLLRVAKLRSFELDETKFWVPSLRDKGSELLEVLLFWHSKGHALNRGHMRLDCDYETLSRETLRIRINRLVKLKDSVDSVLMANKPIEKLFSREGITFSSKLLGLEGYQDPFQLHPIVWEINAKGESYYALLEELMNLNTIEDGVVPEPSSVEYIPNLMTTVYFGQAHHLKQRYLSSSVLRAYYSLLAQKEGLSPSVTKP